MSGGFPDLGLLPELVKATQTAGWLLPSDVQDEAIPLMLGGGDVMVAAQTGSGKTGAFGLPAVQLAYEIRQRQLSGVGSGGGGGGGGAAAAAASAPAVGPAALSVEDRSSWLAVDPTGLIAQSRNEHTWGGVRGTVGVRRGKVYFECTMRDEGIARVGAGTVAASLDLGTCSQGFGYGGTAKRSNSRRFEPYGETFGKGDVIGVMLNVTGVGAKGSAGSGSAGTIAFSKNGVPQGEAFQLPATATPLFPVVCMRNGEVEVNFGSKRWAHAPPSGFVGLASPPAAAAAAAVQLAALAPAAASASPASDTPASKAPLVLVLEPTRDLAEQTFDVLSGFAAEVPGNMVRCALLCGGVDGRKIASAIAKGVEVVVGTPSRVFDATAGKKGGGLDLSRVRVLVLDEADRLVNDAEDRDRIDKIWAKLPRAGVEGERLQTCFFSATLHSPQIASLAARVCHEPTWVDLKGKDSVPDTVHHAVVEVDPRRDLTWAGPLGAAAMRWSDSVHSTDRRRGLGALPAPGSDGAVSLTESETSLGVKLLKLVMLADVLDAMGKDQCMIFCRTNMDCELVCGMLTQLGGGAEFRAGSVSGSENAYSAVMVGGAVPGQQRRANLAAFKDGAVRCLVCTDAVARGIDVTGLPFMINFTLPDDAEQYVHRSGRVGRADCLGLAVSLVAATGCRERLWFLQKSAGRLGRDNIPSDRRDFAAGGNCVWSDEAASLAAVEARLAKGGFQGMVAPATAAGKPTIPRIAAVPLVRPDGSDEADAAVAAKAAALPGAFALSGMSSGASSSSGSAVPRIAPSGRRLLYGIKFPPGIGTGSGAAYGETAAADGGSAEGAARLMVLRPTVDSLCALEQQSQSAYLSLRARFGGAGMRGADTTDRPGRPLTAAVIRAETGDGLPAAPKHVKAPSATPTGPAARPSSSSSSSSSSGGAGRGSPKPSAGGASGGGSGTGDGGGNSAGGGGGSRRGRRRKKPARV